jgi:hypothetical protein
VQGETDRRAVAPIADSRARMKVAGPRRYIGRLCLVPEVDAQLGGERQYCSFWVHRRVAATIGRIRLRDPRGIRELGGSTARRATCWEAGAVSPSS